MSSDEPLMIGQVANPLEWEHWPECEAFLTPALDLSDESWVSVKKEIAAGDQKVVGVMDGQTLIAAATLRTIVGKAGNILEIFLVGGKDVARWCSPLAQAIEGAGRHAGCVAVRAWGRPGWKSQLWPIGWKTDVWCFEKAL